MLRFKIAELREYFFDWSAKKFPNEYTIKPSLVVPSDKVISLFSIGCNTWGWFPIIISAPFSNKKLAKSVCSLLGEVWYSVPQCIETHIKSGFWFLASVICFWMRFLSIILTQ